MIVRIRDKVLVVAAIAVACVLVVISSSGTLNSSALAQEDRPHWEFGPAVVDGPKRDLVSSTGVWVGEAPAPSFASRCHAEVIGLDGTVVWRSDAIDLGTPGAATRTRGRLSFAADPNTLSRGEPRIICAHLMAEGWVATSPRVERPESDHDHSGASAAAGSWVVTATAQWSGDLVEDIMTQCEFRLMSRDGAVLGERLVSFPGPRPDGQTQTRMSVPVEAPAGAEASRASVNCRAVGPEQVEEGE